MPAVDEIVHTLRGKVDSFLVFLCWAGSKQENPNVEVRRNAGEGAAGLSNPKQIRIGERG
jgi:hypothetical protein